MAARAPLSTERVLRAALALADAHGTQALTMRRLGQELRVEAMSLIGSLRAAGFSIELADRAWNALDSHIYGFTLQELNFPFSSEEIPEAAKALLPLAPTDEYPYLNEMGSHVIETDYDGVVEFEFGLDLVLDGLERLLGAPGGG